MPAAGTLVAGLAGSIKVNANVDPAQGGDPARLRDGGISGNPAYLYNATGAAAIRSGSSSSSTASTRSRPSIPRRARGLGDPVRLLIILGRVAPGIPQVRRRGQRLQAALLERASDALTKVTGVNLDEEMTLLLELERTYQASTRLVATIDNMLGALLQAAG